MNLDSDEAMDIDYFQMLLHLYGRNMQQKPTSYQLNYYCSAFLRASDFFCLINGQVINAMHYHVNYFLKIFSISWLHLSMVLTSQ